MKTKLPFSPLLRCTLVILAICSLTTCQKEITTPQKIVVQAQNYFETTVLTGTSKAVQDNNPRHTVAKEALWAQASVETMPFGEAVVVPLAYKQDIALQTEIGPIPLSELSYLLIYKDAQKQYRTEVVTKLPEKNYWLNHKNPKIPFKGVVLVEDWWGNTLKNIGLGIKGPENQLGYVIPQAKGQKPPAGNMMLEVQQCYNQYWEIMVCDFAGMNCVTVHGSDPVCYTVYSDTGGGGGGGSNTPSPIDYGYMPHAGAGGYNTPPPPPPPALLDTTMTPKFYKNAKAMCALNTLMQNNYYKTTLNNFIGENKPLDLTFKLVPIIDKPGEITYGIAAPKPLDWNAKNIDLTLNENVIGNLPSIVVALTLLHEGIHAEMFRKLLSLNGPSNLDMDNFPSLFNMFAQYKNAGQGADYQHQFMANYYINIMSAALKQYDSSQYSLDYYQALAWEGLHGTDVWKNKSAADTVAINNKVIQLLSGRSKTNCNDRYAE
jgi:hypothetical protein